MLDLANLADDHGNDQNCKCSDEDDQNVILDPLLTILLERLGIIVIIILHVTKRSGMITL